MTRESAMIQKKTKQGHKRSKQKEKDTFQISSNDENKIKIHKKIPQYKQQKGNTIQSEKKRKFSFKKLCTKYCLAYFIIFLLDIILIIYFARRNVVHLVKMAGSKIFVGQTRNLLFGRNYITVIVTLFFYIYLCAVRFVMERKKSMKKFMLLSFFLLLFVNLILFYIFTKRIY